jgi:hypothetical protein
VTVALAVLFVVGTLKPQWTTRAPPAQPDVVAIHRRSHRAPSWPPAA